MGPAAVSTRGEQAEDEPPPGDPRPARSTHQQQPRRPSGSHGSGQHGTAARPLRSGHATGRARRRFIRPPGRCQ